MSTGQMDLGNPSIETPFQAVSQRQFQLTRTLAHATERLWNQPGVEKLGHVGQALEEGITILTLPVCEIQAPGDTPDCDEKALQ